jgi:hypothetical protein
MVKLVIEDWTIFNRAVRQRAESVGKARLTPPPTDMRPIQPVMRAPPVTPPQPPFQPVMRAPPVLPPPPRSNVWNWGGPLAALAVVLGIVLLLSLAITLPNREVQPSSIPASQPVAPPERVVTNYTTFNTVTFLHGSVVTGWNFASSRADTPNGEFCYFTRPNGTMSQRIEIEMRPGVGRMPYPDDALGLSEEDWATAATKCRWHASSHPVSPRASPTGSSRTVVPPATLIPFDPDASSKAKRT